MIEDEKLSAAILELIADDESYPAHITAEAIINSNAIKENSKDIYGLPPKSRHKNVSFLT